jgi:hypothetical protein
VVLTRRKVVYIYIKESHVCLNLYLYFVKSELNKLIGNQIPCETDKADFGGISLMPDGNPNTLEIRIRIHREKEKSWKTFL